MKLISADKNKMIIELTNEDYHRLFNIAQSVYEEYERLDDGLLDLERHEVKEFKEDVVAIMDARHGITNDEK